MIIKKTGAEFFAEKAYLIKHKMNIRKLRENLPETTIPFIERVDHDYLVLVDNKYLFNLVFARNSYDMEILEDNFYIYKEFDGYRVFAKANGRDIKEAISYIENESLKER